MKTLLFALIVVVALVVSAVYTERSDVDLVAKQKIERLGSVMTSSHVKVLKTRLQAEGGDVALIGLKVGNPAGFTDENILEFQNIRARVDSTTVYKPPFVIEELYLDAPVITYEADKGGLVNIDILKKALGASQPEVELGFGDKTVPLKIIVRRLEIADAVLHVRFSGSAEIKALNIPKIIMRDVGVKQEGIEPHDLVLTIVSEISDAIKKPIENLRKR